MHFRIDGVNAAELTKKVKLHANDPVANLPLAPTNGKPVEDLETKLKRLINARKCMLFMKTSLCNSTTIDSLFFGKPKKPSFFT